jgi:hypothetical protein
MTPAAKPPRTAAAQPIPAPKLYHVTLSCGPIGVIGHCLSDVISTVTELYPDQHILSALVAPEWTE